jgi:hypothetical protein
MTSRDIGEPWLSRLKRSGGDVMNGALTLREYPHDVVRLACDKRGRQGQYWKQSLLFRFGADKSLPDLGSKSRNANDRSRCRTHAVCAMSG